LYETSSAVATGYIQYVHEFPMQLQTKEKTAYKQIR